MKSWMRGRAGKSTTPFLGAIQAEVGSVMCSYNRVNGNYSCGNNETLNTDLKQRAGTGLGHE